MLSSRPSMKILGALMGCALCFSSTAVGATTVTPVTVAATAVPGPAISPWAALSAFSTQSSASAACVAGAAAITAAQSSPPGCVLPVVDTAPVPPARVTPAYVPAVEREGIGLLPILAGLALIAGLAALFLLDDDDDDDEDEVEPISP